MTQTGGDVNITDEDGDTPLYTVEDVHTARFLVEHGAAVDRTNNEGISVSRLLMLDSHRRLSILYLLLFEACTTSSGRFPRSSCLLELHVCSTRITDAFEPI